MSYRYIYLLVLILFFSCKSKQPLLEVDFGHQTYDPLVSTIQIPIRANLDDLQAMINEQIGTVLFEGQMETEEGGEKNIELYIERASLITFYPKNDEIHFSVPLKVWIKKGFQLTNISAEGSITLDFVTRYTIQDDWKITTESEVVEHQWISKPRLKVGIINLPIKYIANYVLKRSKNLIADLVDRQLEEHLDLQQRLEEAWAQIQDPILIEEHYPMYLLLTPEEIGMAPIQIREDSIYSKIFVKSNSEVFIGNPPERSASLELPGFQFMDMPYNPFSLLVPVDISYEAIERMTQEQIEGEVYTYGKKKIKVEKLDIIGVENKMIIQTLLSGSYKGTITFSGKPYYNKERKEIAMKDLEYNLQTSNFFQKLLAGIFKKRLRKQFSKQMVFSVKEHLEQVEKEIQSNLNHYPVTDHVFLSGTLHRFEFNQTYLTDRGIRIELISEGDIELSVD